MKTKILQLLKNSDSYISGQELCERFGVSRTAIWKVMSKLKEEGYEIESVQNRGYRLVSRPDILSASEIESELHTAWIAHPLFYLDSTASTNLTAKNKLQKEGANGLLVVADEQTDGRGRRGRSWQSPKGEAIYMTLALKPDFAPDLASMLTLLMAYAICSAVRQVTGLPALIKWPNDIVVNQKKVCGILTEMDAEPDYIHSVVIGVGINVNQTRFPRELCRAATSLRLETDLIQPRAVLIAKTMEEFEPLYDRFVKMQSLSFVKEGYNNMLVNRNREVVVLEPKGSYEGIAEGINDRGELLVAKKDGTISEVYAGEVSVRGLYGYV